jgi:hypothetical protein
MTTNYGQERRRFPLHLLYNGNSYYLERVAQLEDALADVPKQLHLELMGDGEIDVEWALVIRDVLNQRSAETKLVTHARSSLKNGSALVWLLGDHRLIRDDAKVFFRRANHPEADDIGPEKVWSENDLQYVDSYSEADPEEACHAQVLHYINEFLPVRELAGRIIEVRTLRQFGLVGNEKLDHFLAATLGPAPASSEEAATTVEPTGDKIITSQPAQE